MQAVVMPCCPYCHSKYFRTPGDRLEQATTSYSVLVKCQACKERYYASQQIRYVSRRNPV